MQEPITADETLYRRIPVSNNWYDSSGLSPEAFRPNRRDTDGISLSRSLAREPMEVAKLGKNPKGYYIARLNAGRLMSAGFQIRPDPRPEDPGHCLLVDLKYDASRKSPASSQLKFDLAKKFCEGVDGPFLPE